ncbi:hypothetical protein FSP39_011491 [Pinctada imbricata]|uniref:Calcyclin-binding protein n=1 Tax=Pinctada imbricata TaxID=66713 RepID=A0AA89BM80_PINIB|nr:hypothetical protein FSP39_011491 [Pinctada imbricata]
MSTATRSRVKDMLGRELGKIEQEIKRKESSPQDASMEVGEVQSYEAPHLVEKKPVSVLPKKISNYAWDQSDKFMKIYVTLNGVQNLPTEGVKCEFGPKSFKLQVFGLDNKNQELYVSTLQEEIVPTESYHKVKKDMVSIFLKKQTPKKTWEFVTDREKKDKEKSKPKTDADGEPTDGLMQMMKQMYDDGDDEMKRTIAKAWTESRDKKMEP